MLSGGAFALLVRAGNASHGSQDLPQPETPADFRVGPRYRSDVPHADSADTNALDATSAPESKTCPDCAEQIRFAARKCRFCGYRYTPEAAV
jgi:hypothetical protein